MFPPLACTDPPSVSAVNAVVLTAVGEEAVLQCVASGVPPPRIIWYRGMFNGEMSTRALDLQFTERSPVGRDFKGGSCGGDEGEGLFQESWLVPALPALYTS